MTLTQTEKELVQLVAREAAFEAIRATGEQRRREVQEVSRLVVREAIERHEKTCTVGLRVKLSAAKAALWLLGAGTVGGGVGAGLAKAVAALLGV